MNMMIAGQKQPPPPRLPPITPHPPTMLFRMLVMLAVARLHPPFPPEFDLSALPRSTPCRIFERPAFSQERCGACAAFAVATAVAVRGCVRDGKDWIPSPHRLFDCGGGSCEGGSVIGRLAEVMNQVGEVGDVDKEQGTFGHECPAAQEISTSHRRLGWPHWRTVFHLDHANALALQTELFVYRNPVIVILDPDALMSYYTGEWGGSQSVYHITGPRLQPHAMVAIGWGTDPEPYWLVKNSWGDRWGDRGRGRIAMADISGALVLDARVWRTDWVLLGTSCGLLVLLVVLEVAECWWGAVVKGGGDVKKKEEDVV